MGLFTFGGVDLSSDLEVLEISRQVGNERNVSTDSAPTIGENIKEVSISSKTIEVKVSFASRPIGATTFVDTISTPVIINKNLQELREKIASILHTTEPKKLVLPDEEGRYYNAIPVGDISLAGISDWYDQFTIKFKVPDGVAHSTTYKEFSLTGGVTGLGTLTVENNGTVPALPIFTIENTAENGYVGLVNESGVFQVGNVEEADTEVVQVSEQLWDYTGTKIGTGLTNAQRNVAITNDMSLSQHGTISRVNWDGRDHLKLSSVGTGFMPGAGLTWDIPNDSSGAVGSLNDYIWWRQVFWAGANNQYGILKVQVSDTEGRFLYGVETVKRSQGLQTEYNFLAARANGGYDVLKRWTFNATYLDSHNPFNAPRGYSDLKRNNDIVTVYWWGGYYPIQVPAIKNRRSAKVHVYFGSYNGKPLVTNMTLDGISYRKDFVNVKRDIPNRYQNGSKIIASSENNTVTVNGMMQLSDFATGSKFLTIPPGTSTIEIYKSAWATKRPNVSVKFEERWL